MQVTVPYRTLQSRGFGPGLICRLAKPVLVVPMVLQWLCLAMRYRSLSLSSVADPSIPFGGLAGESKMIYFSQVAPESRRFLADTAAIVADGDAPANAREAIGRHGLAFPMIAKPDIGWCGFGVWRLDTLADLDAYIAAYPVGETFLLQEYFADGGEAGLFYVRWPKEQRGRLLSLTTRQPSPSGSVVWSHRMGGVYRDLSAAITPALTGRIDAIARDMPDLHVARFDVRFASMAGLASGEGFRIIEINGAGSEAIDCFDPDVPFFAAYAGILRKQAMVFAIAAENRARGIKPCGSRALLAAFRRQARLIESYPASN